MKNVDHACYLFILVSWVSFSCSVTSILWSDHTFYALAMLVPVAYMLLSFARDWANGKPFF